MPAHSFCIHAATHLFPRAFAPPILLWILLPLFFLCRFFSFVFSVSFSVSAELLSSLFLSLVALQGKILPCHFAQSVHTACAATGHLYALVPMGSHSLHRDDGLVALLSARLNSPALYALCWVAQGWPYACLLLALSPLPLSVPIPQSWHPGRTHGSGYFLHSSLAGSVWYTVFCFPSELGLLCTIFEHSICSSHEPDST